MREMSGREMSGREMSGWEFFQGKYPSKDFFWVGNVRGGAVRGQTVHACRGVVRGRTVRGELLQGEFT